eukprot:TRINITY_DN3151_c0_g1_i2.p2 TRINITY_DN3151_c0_g1~~TRINITY_DN3151_c0_g1_i2.p2  ORF type:complete len:100 (-),score=15.93 TRINITY_DN3151_c0_g1_i2:617-916(-)
MGTDMVLTAAVGVRCLRSSKEWYSKVLGMNHVLRDEPTFNGEIAMVQNGDAMLALLQLPPGEHPLPGSRSQRGHFAIKCDGPAFWEFRSRLPEVRRAFP